MEPDRRHIEPISPEPLPDGSVVHGASDVGREREENQDFLGFFHGEHGQLLVVCDGMGGHRGGYEASRIAVREIGGAFEDLKDQPPAELLRQAIERADRAVLDASIDDPRLRQMGSTAVCAFLREGQVTVAHVGDSRAYLVRQGRTRRLTRDHTEVNRMVDLGLLAQEDAEHHPMGHWLAQSVGVNDGVDVEIAEPLVLEPGDRLLLCSDGFSGLMEDDEIALLLARQRSLVEALNLGIELCLNRGAPDNVTVLGLDVPGPVPEGEAPDLDRIDPTPTLDTLPVVEAPLRFGARDFLIWGGVGLAGIVALFVGRLLG